MSGPISSDRLKSFIERIERFIDERIGIQGDIRDTFAEAKGVGYDIKTMRKVIALRAMDAADRAEQETLLETYLHALGMVDRIEDRLAAGDSIRKAADAVGAKRSTVHRVSQKRAEAGNGTLAEMDTVLRDEWGNPVQCNNTPPHDADGVFLDPPAESKADSPTTNNPDPPAMVAEPPALCAEADTSTESKPPADDTTANAGGSHDPVSIANSHNDSLNGLKPEVVRVAPPATDPLDAGPMPDFLVRARVAA